MHDITLLTRKSELALWQAHAVKEALLQVDASLNITVTGHSTLGDRDKITPLAELGNKQSFVSELQSELRQRPNAIAVHSLKDLSVQTADGLTLGACLPRADPHDVLISPHENANLLTLPKGARIGTGSPRRRAQLTHIRPDFIFCDIRGNITSRINACLEGKYDAIVLAAAGIERLNLTHAISAYLDFDEMLPAITQGIIGVECRVQDTVIQELLKNMNDPEAWACAQAERAVNVVLGGDCYTPIAAFAQCDDHEISLTALVMSDDGHTYFKARDRAPIADAYALGEKLGKQLLDDGAGALL